VHEAEKLMDINVRQVETERWRVICFLRERAEWEER
jgi:hypothetical protein